MKKYYYLLSFFALLNLNAQVGINTDLPNATLEVASSPNEQNIIDGFIPPKLSGEELKSKDDLYEDLQTGAIIYVTEPVITTSSKTINITEEGYYYFDGIVWQKMKESRVPGSFDAVNGLTVAGDKIKLGGTLIEKTTIATSASNTLNLTGLQDGNVSSDKLLVADNSGTVKWARSNDFANDLSLPTPAIFTLNNIRHNVLIHSGSGGSEILNLLLNKNDIPGLVYNNNGTITFPPGTYQINFTYEAVHNAANCTLSSYFVDFPNPRVSGSSTRIHSTASHTDGALSNHGGTINYVISLPGYTTWNINIGRGQSGNCNGAGMILLPQATHLLVYRLGRP